MRASASAGVVHVIEVPGELTRGRAAQVREAPQPTLTNLPPTHWAKLSLTQAFSPAKIEEKKKQPGLWTFHSCWNEESDVPAQGEPVVRLVNFLLRACASLPFWRAKPLAGGPGAGAGAGSGFGAGAGEGDGAGEDAGEEVDFGLGAGAPPPGALGLVVIVTSC